MKVLVEDIAKALVDHPDQVQVRAVEGEQVTVLELRVAPDDLGKSNRPPGTHRQIHSHALRRRGHEAEEAFYAGNTRVVIRSIEHPTSAESAARDCGANCAPARRARRSGR